MTSLLLSQVFRPEIFVVSISSAAQSADNSVR